MNVLEGIHHALSVLKEVQGLEKENALLRDGICARSYYMTAPFDFFFSKLCQSFDLILIEYGL